MIHLQKVTKNTKKEQNETHTPSRIQLVLEQFCTKQTWAVHSTLIPFFMPCQVTEKGKLIAFIALVNHNSVFEHMVVDICNTMMGE